MKSDDEFLILASYAKAPGAWGRSAPTTSFVRPAQPRLASPAEAAVEAPLKGDNVPQPRRPPDAIRNVGASVVSPPRPSWSLCTAASGKGAARPGGSPSTLALLEPARGLSARGVPPWTGAKGASYARPLPLNTRVPTGGSERGGESGRPPRRARENAFRPGRARRRRSTPPVALSG
jgi:hypothetical protein